MKYTLIVLLLSLLCSCVPYMTYEEMGIAYEQAATPEEKKAMGERIDRFEANADKARIYFDEKAACERSGEVMWACDNAQSVDIKRIKDLDGLVRAYKREHQSCHCYNEDDFMRGLREAGFFNN